MKKAIPGLLTPLFLIALTLGIILWFKSAQQPPNPDDSASYPFIIGPGQNANSIGEKLEGRGFIKSSLAFKLYVQLRGIQNKIQAGDYRLRKNQYLTQLVGELARGPIAVWVTLQEGLRREEMAQKIAAALDLSPKEKQEAIEDFLEESKDREGFLFPDTYLFLRNTTAKTIVEKLTATFEKKVEGERGKAKEGLTFEELIILASIVEREARAEEERPIVAGILLKRLEIGMPLQADATLQYAIADVRCQMSDVRCDWWAPIKAEDKTIKSAYNTYTNRGLPPAPIANPGLVSIKAVVNPEESPYLFYLHDREGNIHYAKTIEEHGENIRKYLQ